MIIDTSVWIDFFRNARNAQTDLVADLLIMKNGPCIIPIILQGVQVDSHFERISKSLLACNILQANPVEAAQLFRFLRKKDVTIRKPNDCLIAHYAMFYNIPVLHNDVDFDQIARFTALRIARA